jgi:hypothetical protein
MAYEIPGQLITLPAGSTTLAQFTFVTVNSSGFAVLPAAGASIAGVLQNVPTLVGEAATVMVSGVSKVVAPGSTVKVGDVVAASSVGFAAALAGGDYAVGRVVSGSSGSTGRYLTVLLSPIGTT